MFDSRGKKHLQISKTLIIFILFILQGCTYRVITDYEDCATEKLYFELKDNLNMYLIDDSNGIYKYSSMNFPKNEYYVCIGTEDRCVEEYKGQYYQGWKIIPISSKGFYLTGRYKTNKPNFILGAFVSETSALQIEINQTTKSWISVYELNDKANFKKSSEKSILKLNRNRKLATDWNDWMTIFECPNPNVKEVDWNLIWFH